MKKIVGFSLVTALFFIALNASADNSQATQFENLRKQAQELELQLKVKKLEHQLKSYEAPRKVKPLQRKQIQYTDAQIRANELAGSPEMQYFEDANPPVEYE